MFSLSGPHRAGKTTICKDVEAKYGIPYFDASVTVLMRSKGIDPVALTSVEERLKNQELLLDLYLENLSAAPRPCLTDRSPLDMAAYMLAEVGMHGCPADLGEEITRYMKRCVEETDLHFGMVIIVDPLRLYEVSPDKPPLNTAYQWHHRFLVAGLAGKLERTNVATVLVEDRERRAIAVGNTLVGELERWKELRGKFLCH